MRKNHMSQLGTLGRLSDLLADKVSGCIRSQPLMNAGLAYALPGADTYADTYWL